MNKRIPIAFMIFAAIVIFAAAVFFGILPNYVGARMNSVVAPVPYQVSQDAVALHKTLTIVDWHADSLLWNRDLLEYGDFGHVDLPRMRSGNVALQAFTVVTKTPRGQNYDSNDSNSDNITMLAIAQRWPRATWSSLLERAKYQAGKLHSTAARSNGKLMLVKNQADLAAMLEARAKDPEIAGGFLGIEGLHCLEGKLENIQALYDAGFRMMGITHFFDNELGGSAHGVEKGRLTPLGRDAVKKMEELNIIIDLAHASPAVIDEVLKMAARPVVVSHTGVKGTCDNIRNFSDEQLRGVAATGGLVGIGFWDAAVCDPTPKNIAKAIVYAVSVIGSDHVTLGSDWDGATQTPFDAANLAEITDALLKANMSPPDIRKVMGDNSIALLQKTLP